MKRILVTGPTGMLGSELVKFFSSNEEYDVYGAGRSNTHLLPPEKQFQIDFSRPFDKVDIKVHPDIIIHTAALTDLTFCEQNPEVANQVHVEASGKLAETLHHTGQFIYISTDSVFDGTKGNYSENDTPNPLNVYASSKLRGEYEVQKLAGDRATILRTNIYGSHIPLKNSIAEWAYREWMHGKTISGFTDMVFNAVYTHQLVEIIEKIIHEVISHPVINIGSNEVISKFDFLEKFRKKLKIDKGLLKPALSTDFSNSLKRPKNTSLNTALLANFCKVPEFDSGICECIKFTRLADSLSQHYS